MTQTARTLSIEPSQDSELTYLPCRAVLRDGSSFDTVYVVSEKPYVKHSEFTLKTTKEKLYSY